MSQRWDGIAEVRKRQIESGKDLTFSKVFVPYYRGLLLKLRPESILEVGGGTGHLGLALSEISERYVMVEPSKGMHRVARSVLAETKVQIRNCPVEALNDDSRFDLVLSHMCVQTVRDLATFLKAISKHLLSRGSFAIALPHPAFYNDYKRFFPAAVFSYASEISGEVNFSITLDPNQIIEGVPYYHRPISKYVEALASAGLCVTAFEEIFPSRAIQELYGAPWKHPRYLVIRGNPLIRASY
ncbi:MAG TPA: class I SAM-dependent methyltransferase [Terriglobales bacterium]|nr:class I SAM-dependent methyltransferase [Terriglobales bacterium]